MFDTQYSTHERYGGTHAGTHALYGARGAKPYRHPYVSSIFEPSASQSNRGRERKRAALLSPLRCSPRLAFWSNQPRWKTVPVLELEPNEGRAGGATEENELVVPAVGRAGDAGKAVARLTRRTWPDASSCA